MPHVSLVALMLLSLISCLKSRGGGGVAIQENVTPPTVSNAIDPTIAYLPPKPKVPGDELTATNLVVQPVNIGTQQIVYLTVEPDIRADFLQLSICQDTSPSPLCFPKVDNAEVFIAPEHYFPNAPIGHSFVQVRACVKPENALDVSKLCGTWSQAPYFQAKENPDDAWKTAIGGVHDGLQKYLEPCTDLQGQINTYLTAHPDQAAGKDTYSILLQNFINMGEFTCAQLLQNNILTQLTPPTDTETGTDTDTLVATVPPDPTDVDTDSQIAENTNPTDDNTNVLVETPPTETPPESGGGGWSDAKIGVFTTGIGLIAMGAVVAFVYGKRLASGSVEATGRRVGFANPTYEYRSFQPRSIGAFSNPTYETISGDGYNHLNKGEAVYAEPHQYDLLQHVEILPPDDIKILQEKVAVEKNRLEELQKMKQSKARLNSEIGKFVESGRFANTFGSQGDVRANKNFLKMMMSEYHNVIVAAEENIRKKLLQDHVDKIKQSNKVQYKGIWNSERIKFLQNLQLQFESDLKLYEAPGTKGGAQMNSPSKELQRIAGMMDVTLDAKISLQETRLAQAEASLKNALAEVQIKIHEPSPTPSWHSKSGSPVPGNGEPSPNYKVGEKPATISKSKSATGEYVAQKSTERVKSPGRGTNIAGTLVGVGMIVAGILTAALSATQMDLAGTTPDPQVQALQTAGENAYERAEDIRLEILGANLTLLQLKLDELQGK